MAQEDRPDPSEEKETAEVRRVLRRVTARLRAKWAGGDGTKLDHSTYLMAQEDRPGPSEYKEPTEVITPRPAAVDGTPVHRVGRG